MTYKWPTYHSSSDCMLKVLSRDMGGSRGGGGQGVRTPLKNHKNIGFSSNTGWDPLKNRKATKSAFNVRPSLAPLRNTISLAGR